MEPPSRLVEGEAIAERMGSSAEGPSGGAPIGSLAVTGGDSLHRVSKDWLRGDPQERNSPRRYLRGILLEPRKNPSIFADSWDRLLLA